MCGDDANRNELGPQQGCPPHFHSGVTAGHVATATHRTGTQLLMRFALLAWKAQQVMLSGREDLHLRQSPSLRAGAHAGYTAQETSGRSLSTSEGRKSRAHAGTDVTEVK